MNAAYHKDRILGKREIHSHCKKNVMVELVW
jgi:hypothetical protein